MSIDRPAFTKKNLNLADPRLGAKVYFATDDFFADKSRMIAPEAPVFIADKYDENGKWMDGWESRRKRVPGYDFSLINLGHICHVEGIELDTRHFTGNNAPAASLQAFLSTDAEASDSQAWEVILPRTELEGDSRKFIKLDAVNPCSHLRLNIYPDGGISRIRVYGHILYDPAKHGSEVFDVAAALNGGRPVACSDEHFGVLSNLIAPGKGLNMGDGWETARRRNGGNDWAILALATPSIIENISVDTAFFKGNYPSKCSLEGLYLPEGSPEEQLRSHDEWQEILKPTNLTADSVHAFKPTKVTSPITHIRLNIFPDGGISRLRLLGRPA